MRPEKAAVAYPLFDDFEFGDCVRRYRDKPRYRGIDAGPFELGYDQAQGSSVLKRWVSSETAATGEPVPLCLLLRGWLDCDLRRWS